MGNVQDPVAALAGWFDKRHDLRALVVPRRDGATAAPAGDSAGQPTDQPTSRFADQPAEQSTDQSADQPAGRAAGRSADRSAPGPALNAIAEFDRHFAEARATLELALKHGATAGDLAEDARRPEIGDLAAMSPRQAAITVAAILFEAPKGLRPETLVDAWVAARGVPFAAEATVELAGFAVSVLHQSNDTPALRRSGSADAFPQERFAIAAHTRRHLAAASDADHAAAGEAVSALRQPTDLQSTAAAFLFPERTDWTDRELDRQHQHRTHGQLGFAAWLLLGALTTGDQAVEFARWAWSDDVLRLCPAATATAFATVGVDLVPALVIWAEHTWDADVRLRVQRPLAGLDSDESMRALLGMLGERGTASVLLEAAARFPERGVRILAEDHPNLTVARATVERVLRIHVSSHPDAARAVLPALSADAAVRVEKLLNAATPMPFADAAALPELLVSPPWRQERHRAAKPTVVKGLTPVVEAAVVWADDAERERWSVDPVSVLTNEGQQWDRLLSNANTRWDWQSLMCVIARAPEDKAREGLQIAINRYTWGAEHWGPAATVRFGADALPAILNAARESVFDYGELVLPFACSEVAPLAAHWALRLKTARTLGQTWLRRHPGVAARALVPDAVGKASKARQAAEAALRFLAADGFETEVRAAAAGYGAAAESGIADLLSQDPLYATLPKAMPEVPLWAEPHSLPQVLLADRRHALPPEAVRNLVQMLTVSTPETPYPGLASVRELCDARSLAGFAWALFENWQTADHPAKQSFAFDALRWFGDDDAVRRLSPLIRVWPGEGGHARAVTGLDVLAAIGGDTALIHLYGISQKVKFKGLKETAQGRITAIAEELRLTREQLADRLVPNLGLDDAGALELDYGPRRFTVFFDEQLKPGVADESGKRLKTLPKPGAKDDAELAPAAYQRFTGLKKDVRTLASDQITRLELAMVTRRRWTRAEFEEYLVGHPLLRHLVRRLVWADFPAEGGAPRATFRVAEDLTCADVDDDPFSVADDARIGVAHPVDLGADLPRWSEVFADYEILQPFQQLGRPVFTLTAEEAGAVELKRFDGLQAPGGKVLGLERRGWRRSDPEDAGWQGYLLRELPGDQTLVIDLDPGFGAGWAGSAEDQKFRAVWIDRTQNGYSGYWRRHGDSGVPFSVLDPVTASEVLRDLTEVTAK